MHTTVFVGFVTKLISNSSSSLIEEIVEDVLQVIFGSVKFLQYGYVHNRSVHACVCACVCTYVHACVWYLSFAVACRQSKWQREKLPHLLPDSSRCIERGQRWGGCVLSRHPQGSGLITPSPYTTQRNFHHPNTSVIVHDLPCRFSLHIKMRSEAEHTLVCSYLWQWPEIQHGYC